MAEWLKAIAWKVISRDETRLVGSNPTDSLIFNIRRLSRLFLYTKLNTGEYIMKSHIISHNDLDGYAGPAIASRYLLQNPQDTLAMSYCNTGSYGDVDDTLTKILDDIESGAITLDNLYIMDLTPQSNDVIQRLLTIVDTHGIEFRCLDHHKSALHLNDIDNRFMITVDIDSRLQSASTLVYNYFASTHEPNEQLNEFAELVRSYDTWDWVNDPNDKYKDHARDWNSILYLIGPDRFEQHLIVSLELTDTHKLLLEMEHEKQQVYMAEKLQSASFDRLPTEESTASYAIIDAEQYASELGNTMCRTLIHPQTNELIDFAIIRNGTRLSFRSDNKVDVSIIAKQFNGGGHQNAAGGQGPLWPLK